MATVVLERLRAAIDELAGEAIEAAPQSESVIALAREMARLDAQLARRLSEVDRSGEWSLDGARSAAGCS
ncbi:MAG TPA: hypothetical protein VH914_06810 [Acidimicrobiia bacterium]|nr:hypothetical protein [Acidimicrobiia bacterium]